EVGAGGVAPGVPGAAVLLFEQAAEGGAVLVGEAPLLPDPVVPVLGQGLGHLHGEAVEEEVVLVPVGGEEFGGVGRGDVAHRHHVEGGVVGFAGGGGAEEVGDRQPGFLPLAGEREPQPFVAAGVV